MRKNKIPSLLACLSLCPHTYSDCPEPPVQEVLLRKFHVLPSVGDAHNAPLPGTCCSSPFLSD